MLLPLIGGTLGGIEGYRQGGLGGAVLGAGLGAVTPAGLRLAGSALGAKLAPGLLSRASAGALSKASQVGKTAADLAKGGALSQFGGKALEKTVVPGLTALSQNIGSAAGLGGLAAGTGLALGAAGLTGGLGGRLAGGVGQALGGAGQSAAGIIGYTADGAPVYGGAALPPGLGQYGATSPEGMPSDVLGPSGMGRRLETLKAAQTQRDVLRTLLPEIEAAAEARSKKEMERQMAAAGIRQNIRTRAAMQERAQTAGLEAGLDALQKAGGALTSQYQYQ
tara:strand:- start:598 stop:1434 length:837 start_codon:yes stop_codon:yes gene_type:complete